MPCDPIENNFPDGAVSSAGNTGENGGSGGPSGNGIDPGILDKLIEPPEGKPLWWIVPSKEPIPSNEPTNTGRLPAECLSLIRQPSRPIPSKFAIGKSKRPGGDDKSLKKVCRELLKQNSD